MEAGDPGPETLTLLIKTPDPAQQDQLVRGVHPDWTVRDLKVRLTAELPHSPAVNDQRLIYAGKLLQDHLHVKEIFRQTDPVPTLHLVCACRDLPQGRLGAGPKSRQEPRPTPASESAGPSSSSRLQTPGTAELRQRRQTAPGPDPGPAPHHTHTPASPPWTPAWPVTAAAPGTPQMSQPAFPTYSLYSPQQLLWLQHVYVRQYYMQYHAALAAAGTLPSAPPSAAGQYPPVPVPVPAHPVPVAAALANQNPIQNPAQDGAFINPAEANQNLRMNAQGGPVMEDEEDVERDWLDWLYSAARFCVLLMIVYFNSNLSRFLLVMSTLFLMYLHTAGWFPFRRLQVQRANHLQAPEVQHNQQNENRIPDPDPAEEFAEGQREEPAAADGSEDQEPMAAVLVPPHRVSVMWTAWVFFKTFFSSPHTRGSSGCSGLSSGFTARDGRLSGTDDC